MYHCLGLQLELLLCRLGFIEFGSPPGLMSISTSKPGAKTGVIVATTIMVARIGIVNNGILFLIIGFSIGWITLSFVNRLI